MEQQQQIEEIKAKLAALSQEGQESKIENGTEPYDSQVTSERRTQFPASQQRLAAELSRGNKAFDLIEGRSGITATMDKLVVLQIIKLMLDADGNDGILYAATGWSSGSKQTLADRMGDHKSQNECNPQWRLGMQSQDRQEAYAKKLAGELKLPYVEPKPEDRLEDAIHMSSRQFAEFAVDFHRKVLQWDLKAYIYANLTTPAKEFFAGFVDLQKESDDQQATVFNGAYSAHLRAADPALGEDAAQDFLDMLSNMRWLENREKERSAERIAKQAPVAEVAVPEVLPEPKRQSTVADQVKAASRLCDIELAKLEEKIAALKAGTGG